MWYNFVDDTGNYPAIEIVHAGQARQNIAVWPSLIMPNEMHDLLVMFEFNA